MVSQNAFEIAQQVKEAVKNDDWLGNSEKVVTLVTQLVDEMANNGYGADNGEMYCWLRPKKWEISSTILDLKTARELAQHPANLDRVLYKSANLLALQALAKTAAERTAIPNHK
jgi:hypothetical protein